MRKKVDSRVRTLIENGVKSRQRTIVVVVGDKARDQVVNLHYMLSKSVVASRPKVLWCYKKDLGFTSHQRKRMRQMKRDVKRGVRDEDSEDPFELFLSCTDLTYCYYKDSHRVLGRTFGCVVLQDFEALTPNILARTVETVEGGGLILVLLKTMDSLRQLSSLSMDVHSRFRTASHQDITPRFNERFLLSLSNCSQCLVVDDQLTILPISSSVLSLSPVTSTAPSISEELVVLRDSMRETEPIGALLEASRTADQAKAVLCFIEAIADKTLNATVALTASRGRGKSAALGISVAGAIAYGYSNIFVTAPSPENLATLFEIAVSTLKTLDYKEHVDYEIIESTNAEFKGCTVRLNVFKESHRQTVQYIHPSDHKMLAQAELLVIDEAAAIPLPVVKSLLGPYLVFVSSTINGYEGTGRSLSLKLFKQLRKDASGVSAASSRTLKEIDLEEPIRYAPGDHVETWLNKLLCLDVSQATALNNGTPPPSKCELFYVNRDTLFSHHKASERFLSRMMSLFVASHYKNSPNDLQLMADAPAHHLFVLLGPQLNSKQLPDILAVIQVCLEGEISKSMATDTLSRGERKSGDLIPWTITQQYQDYEFPQLSGLRVVRIATHPELTRMGYGSRAMELLMDYYQGKFTNLSEDDAKPHPNGRRSPEATSLETEIIVPMTNLPPLLERLVDRPCERLHYIGTSFGLTLELLEFWKKGGLRPVYIRQTPNELTGEHSCIMLRSLEESVANMDLRPESKTWLDGFSSDFRLRLMSLFSYSLSSFSAELGLSLLDPSVLKRNASNPRPYNWEQLQMFVCDYDVKRLDCYSRNMVDYHLILDLIPALTRLVLSEHIPCTLSYAQAAILLGVGLQHKSVSTLESELSLQSNQILALFNKTTRKIGSYLKEQKQLAVRATIPTIAPEKRAELLSSIANPVPQSLNSELNSLGHQVEQDMMEKQRELLDGMDLDQYQVKGDDHDWKSALAGAGARAGVSVKGSNVGKFKRKPDQSEKKVKTHKKKSTHKHRK